MDDLAIARVLGEIADPIDIKGENPFKVRAYRNGADAVAHWSDALAPTDDATRRGIPGIGRDLAGRIRELVDTGRSAFHQALLQELPPTILDLMKLVVSSDVDARAGLGVLRWGAMVARRAWASPADVLNTRPVEAFRAGLRRNGGGR